VKRPLIITLTAIAAVAIVAVVIIVNLTRPAPEPNAALPGSKNSNVTASPVPTTTTAPPVTPPDPGAPTPVPSWPAECLDEDTAPEYCMTIVAPGAGPAVTAEQFAAESGVSAFATQWGLVRADETSDARAARLAPFVADSARSVLTQKTELARSDTKLVGLHADATATVLYSTYLEPDSAGNWVYTVQATFNGKYTQTATGSVSNFSGPATFTVTIDHATHKVLSVTESIPALTGAP
jgi:hypothetical protein